MAGKFALAVLAIAAMFTSFADVSASPAIGKLIWIGVKSTL